MTAYFLFLVLLRILGIQSMDEGRMDFCSESSTTEECCLYRVRTVCPPGRLMLAKKKIGHDALFFAVKNVIMQRRKTM